MEGCCGVSHAQLAAFPVFLYVVVLGSVNIGVDFSRIEPDVFHDVDLATGRPRRLGVGAEHPDGGPGSAATGKPGSNFNPTMRPACLAAGRQTPRGIFSELAVSAILWSIRFECG